MNLVENFDLFTSSYTEPNEQYLLNPADEPFDHPPAPSTSYESPLFVLESTVKQAARGRGQVVAVGCASDVVVVATSRGFLIRYTWDEYGNEKVAEVEVTRLQDNRILRIFLDPGGNHLLALLRSPHSHEVHYLHRKWQKSKVMSKLKNLEVTAVAWQKQVYGSGGEGVQSGEDAGSRRKNTAGSTSEVSSLEAFESWTGEVLLGTQSGTLHELVVDEKQRKEVSYRVLLDLRPPAGKVGPVCALEQELLACGRRVVIMATTTSLYIIYGSKTLESVFLRYQSATVPLVPLLEFDHNSSSSTLFLSRPVLDPTGLPTQFAWWAGGLLCHGTLLLQKYDNDDTVNQAEEYVGYMKQLRVGGEIGDATSPASPSLPARGPGNAESAPGSSSAASSDPMIRSFVASQYHYTMMMGDRLVAINQVNGKVVHEVVLRGPSQASGPGTTLISGTPLGLYHDLVSQRTYLASSEGLWDVEVRNESRDMWKVYLEAMDYDQALKLCSNSSQRDTVYLTMAQGAMERGDYDLAAKCYAKIVGSQPCFEEIALQLVEVQDPEALQTFLSTKLEVLHQSDRAQATMVSTWLTELYLDQINKSLLMSGGKAGEEYALAHEKLKKFLTERVEVLDVNTTITLLITYGRLDDLMTYAQARNDHEAVLEYLMNHHPNGAREALTVLRKPSVSQELVYKFAPGMIGQCPEDTVDFWITARPPLEPRRLLPALLRFGEPGSSPQDRSHVLRYIRFCLEQLGCQDGAVHNLAVALLSQQDDERDLLSLIGRAKTPSGVPFYDPKYALRLALERHRPRSCVALMCLLGLYEEAVKLALEVDLELAKSVANGLEEEEDEGVRRKLWLAIAKYVVEHPKSGNGTDEATNIKQAVDFLKEAGGLLKIEDILPFFPDFVTIDNFKEAICESLHRYNRQIEELKREMDEATDIAEAVRRDLKMLQNRTAVVSLSENCSRCGRPIGEGPPGLLNLPTGGVIPPFYLFPTQRVYHTQCCAAEVMALVRPEQASKITRVLTRLSKVAGDHVTMAPAYNGCAEEPVAKLQAVLEEEVGAEDPRCGEVTIQMIEKPFIDPQLDAMEIQSWKL